jgi:hypothetical protein
MSTICGLVAEKHECVFKDLASCWTKAHIEVVLNVVKKNHNSFLEQEKEKIRQHERIQKLKEREEKAEKRILRESLNQVSYFTIPTLKTIK